MASTKRDYSTHQPHRKQRQSAAVQVPFWRQRYIGYLVCLPLVGLAMLGSLLEQQLGLHAYFSSAPLLLAIVLIALLWGTGPAIIAILVSLLVLDYLGLPPTGSFDIHTWDGLLQVLPFVVSGALIAIITAQRETARRRALMAEREEDNYADKLELDNRLLNEAMIETNRELDASLDNIPQSLQVLRYQVPVWQGQVSEREVVQQALEQMDVQTSRLQALNTSLLSFTKDRASEIGTLSIPYDLCAACRALVADLSLSEGRTIEMEAPSHPIMVHVVKQKQSSLKRTSSTSQDLVSLISTLNRGARVTSGLWSVKPLLSGTMVVFATCSLLMVWVVAAQLYSLPANTSVLFIREPLIL